MASLPLPLFGTLVPQSLLHVDLVPAVLSWDHPLSHPTAPSFSSFPPPIGTQAPLAPSILLSTSHPSHFLPPLPSSLPPSSLPSASHWSPILLPAPLFHSPAPQVELVKWGLATPKCLQKRPPPIWAVLPDSPHLPQVRAPPTLHIPASSGQNHGPKLPKSSEPVTLSGSRAEGNQDAEQPVKYHFNQLPKWFTSHALSVSGDFLH